MCEFVYVYLPIVVNVANFVLNSIVKRCAHRIYVLILNIVLHKKFCYVYI